MLCATQRDPNQQQRVSDVTIHALKETFPFLLGEMKDSAILNKSLARDGDWSTIKEILGWVTDTHQGTLNLSSK